MTSFTVHPDDPRVAEFVNRLGPDTLTYLQERHGSSADRLMRDQYATHLGGIPARYRWADLGMLAQEQHPEGIVAWLKDRDALTLWFDGPVGVGKTMAAAATANEHALIQVRRGEWGPIVRWWTVAGLIDALRPGRDEDDGVWVRAKNARLLVLDDFAHVRPSSWAVERLWMLVNHRVAEGLRTVCTTNMAAADLRAVWGDGVVDRLNDAAYAIQIAGESRRAPLAVFGGDE